MWYDFSVTSPVFIVLFSIFPMTLTHDISFASRANRHLSPSCPVALEQNLTVSQESLLIFYIPNESISELKVNT